MTLTDPVKLLRMYDRGGLTGHELCFHLLKAAATLSPAEIAPLLPPNVLADVRRESAEPPSSLAGLVWFGGGNFISQAGMEQRIREDQRLWLAGVWEWHRYFRAGQDEGRTKDG
jgi:hypothetical protein